MTDQAPGWYADPRGAAQTWRWWDGAGWTSWLADDPGAPDPGAEEAQPLRGLRQAQGAEEEAQPLRGLRQAQGAEEGAQPLRGLRQDQVAEPRVALPLAVLVIVGAVILAVVIVGAVVWAASPRLPSGPEIAPPAPGVAGGSTVDYDSATRTASVDELRVMLPGAPYTCQPDATANPPLFTSVRSCSTVIHADYNGKGDDWQALFAVAAVGDSEVVPGNLTKTADRVYQQMVELYFADQQTTIKNRSSGPLDIAEPGKALSTSSEIHYEVEGVPSTYTRMLMAMVQLSDGSYAVCFSLRTDDTPKATLDVLNAALATATAK